jgi:hypothetical protein
MMMMMMMTTHVVDMCVCGVHETKECVCGFSLDMSGVFE